MTGPEHYREAERALDLARVSDIDRESYALGVAQVHATLALAAAIALQQGGDSPMLSQDWEAWVNAASEDRKMREALRPPS